MGRFDSSLGDASRPAVRHVPKAAVLAGSVLLGAILVWVLARPLAPHVDEAVLFSRFALFCLSHGFLFGVCEWMASARTMVLSPLVGPTAAAVTTSMYLLVGGVPSEVILLAINCFLLGFQGFACLRVPEEGRGLAVFKMLSSMSFSTVLFSAAVLVAAMLNCLLAAGQADVGLF